jgi:hypothetical protein
MSKTLLHLDADQSFRAGYKQREKSVEPIQNPKSNNDFNGTSKEKNLWNQSKIQNLKSC